MKVLLVLAHAEQRSFCAALYTEATRELAAAGHEIRTSDLYAMGFDPVGDKRDFLHPVDPHFFKYQKEQTTAVERASFAPDLAGEMDKIVWADLVIFCFPLWWFSVPAILKGWFDRTLAMGFAYGGGRWFETGPFHGKRALLAITAGAPDGRYAEGAIFGSIEHVLYPLHVGVLNLSGFDVLSPFIVWAPARIGDEKRRERLEAWRQRLREIEAETPLPMHRVADHPDPYAEPAQRQK
jgi:NAD(P)H dehydrogenase (quinone)